LTSTDIARDEVHLWDTPLSVDDNELIRIENQLPADERTYADEFRHAGARRQYVISRGKLRELLWSYVGEPAAELRLETEGDGKPVLAKPRKFEFNLSHSGDLVLYAVASSRAVGVDVECVRPIPRAVELARRFLSKEEHDIVAAAPAGDRDREFLSMWVKRESYAKALGTSVWRALGSRGPSGTALSEGDADSTARRASTPTVQLFDYSVRYVAAVAASGSDWRVVRRGTF
jgi:4'-phosphopantetheinyl transferase